LSSINATQATSVEAPTRDAKERLLWTISFILVLIAVAITGYMTYNKLAGQTLPCTNEGYINCAVVESSAWASILGVPTATWGLVAHLGIGAVLLLSLRQSFFQNYGILIVFGIALFGVLYHGYLLYVSFSVLRAFCTWCVAAAAVMLAQLVVTGIRLRRSVREG
jgi:uncharacterized membrane protein